LKVRATALIDFPRRTGQLRFLVVGDAAAGR
jgi:hypothetical protein